MGLVIVLVAVLMALVVARWLIAYLRFRRLELAIPGPPSLPLLGNVFAFAGVTEDGVWDRVLGLWGGRTELSRFSIGPILVIFATDPDDIEKVVRGRETQDKASMYKFVDFIASNGLLTANRAIWKAHRKAIQPAFHPEVLNRYQDVFRDECLGFCGCIEDGVNHDVVDSLRLVTSKAFMRTALVDAIGTSGEEDALFPVIMALIDVFPPTVTKRSSRPWLWSNALFRLSSAGRQVGALIDRTNEAFRRVVVSRRKLLKQKKAVSEDFVKERRTLLDVLLEGSEDGLLVDDQLIQEIKLFFGAAVETMVSTLGWTFKVLSVRQDIQDRMLEEVKMVLGKEDVLTPHHVTSLEYTERVIKEALRLVPSAVFMARNVNSEFVLSGRTIPKDSTIVLNVYGAHRDPRHWEEPLKFDPDRFLPERSVGRHRYAYLPFSLGPRNCIGEHYAMRFMKTLLASVVSKYRVDPVDDGHTDPAKFPMSTRITTYMPGGTHVVFSQRA